MSNLFYMSWYLQVKVVDFTARVEVQQLYTNKERNPIECIYYFPVEESAAVVGFEAEVDGRFIQSKVQHKCYLGSICKYLFSGARKGSSPGGVPGSHEEQADCHLIGGDNTGHLPDQSGTPVSRGRGQGGDPSMLSSVSSQEP